MEEKIITRENINSLCRDIIDGGNVMITPGQTEYSVVKDVSQVVLDAGAKPTKASYKTFVFPKAEPILYYKRGKNDVQILDPEIEQKQTVIFGAKPCDTNSFSILKHLFNWDYKDEFFNLREKNFIVIGLMCNFSDEFCFCTSVGSSPVSDKGSDIFLIPLDGTTFAARIVTEKGKEFVNKYAKHFTEGSPAKSEEITKNVKQPVVAFDSKEVHEWLGKNFEHPKWEGVGDVCLSCAQCAFVCPVCHCFDIVDEDYSYSEGRRMKHWDGCQFGHFTLHASGHNPRDIQGKRYRQRINHKFKYYVDKFGEILCTGCGRCSRGCAVSIDIKEIVSNCKD
ncbi:MAG: 4Fe-4S dicluster domain-containing protein [Ignavibacteria bacterium]|jgi:ferredoxin|nr:4Fe-4S dicluster domain-containing protein [Ignavibacteria bacterium]